MSAVDRDVVPGLPVGQYINLGDGSLTRSVRSASVGRGVEVVLDVVVGPLFEPCLRCLTYRERHISVTSTGDGRVGFDLVDFYHREGRIYGGDTLKLGFAESAAVLRVVMPGIQRGTSPPRNSRQRRWSRRSGPTGT